jgi:L-amino acid N-acyltransferase YncA
MNPITIRRATAADLRQIGALWAQLVAYHQALMHSAPVARADGPAHYAERIGRSLWAMRSRILMMLYLRRCLRCNAAA